MLEEGAPVKEGEGNRQSQHRALMSSCALQASRSASRSVVQMRKLSLEKLCLQVQSVPLPERAAPPDKCLHRYSNPRHWIRGCGVRKSLGSSKESEFGPM